MTQLARRVLLALLALFVLAPAVPALAVKTATPPADAKAIFQWIASLLAIIVVAAIVFKNAKRSHQN